MYCGWDLAEYWMRSCLVRMRSGRVRMRYSRVFRTSSLSVPKLQQSWVQSQHPPTQWNLSGGKWSSVEQRTWEEKIYLKILIYMYCRRLLTQSRPIVAGRYHISAFADPLLYTAATTSRTGSSCKRNLWTNLDPPPPLRIQLPFAFFRGLK